MSLRFFDSFFPLYLVATAALWTAVLRYTPPDKSVQLLGLCHGALVTVTSLRCIFRGDDTAFSCAASVSFFVVDAIHMLMRDGFLSTLMMPLSCAVGLTKCGGGSSDDGEVEKKGEEAVVCQWSKLRTARKMDYVHHLLGVTFGTVQHYWERDLCHPSVGNAFIYVQWNEISTPFYNLFRMTNNAVLGATFALTFFLSRVVGNTLLVIPLLYGNCSDGIVGKIHGLATAPYFLLQYVWFYMIVKKMVRMGAKKTKKECGADNAGVARDIAPATEKKLD